MKSKMIAIATLLFAFVATPAQAGWGSGDYLVYGWQNHSWEFVDTDFRTDEALKDTDVDRISTNAGNIGFLGSYDTGVNGITVNWRCEQFTYLNGHAGTTGWCNRNSKIGLHFPGVGEIMWATWLLPYNEMVAQWIDPFYDAGSDSHTSIMGSPGFVGAFYNVGAFSGGGAHFQYQGSTWDLNMNRRQENIVQFWSDDWNGIHVRYAFTVGERDDSVARNTKTINPDIHSAGIAYTNGPAWMAVTWQKHDDWTAAAVCGTTICEDSDTESWRIAANYTFNVGEGTTLKLMAMYEDLEYEMDTVSTPGAALDALGMTNITDAAYGVGTADTDIKVERDAWHLGLKLDWPGPFDLRATYQDADDLDIDAPGITAVNTKGQLIDDDTAADAYNIGLFYQLGDSTELRLTYSKVDNDDRGGYGQGISGTGIGNPGVEIEMWALGIVHAF